jgi:two-component system, LytTR family, response regulator
MIRTIIIDDEQHCIDRLRDLLREGHGDLIEVTDVCLSAEEGEKAIRHRQPDLVFLDIQIRDATGFELLQRIGTPDFEIIFTTAHDKYALEAFRFSAIDYLLKPVDAAELGRSLARLEKVISKEEMGHKLDALFHNLRQIQGSSRKICVPVVTGLVFISVSDIIRCQSEINYTILFLRDRQKLTVARTLKEFEDMLGDSGFYRVHNSHLVNLDYIKSYNKGKGGYLTMTDNSQVEVSTRRKEEFLKKLTER